MKPDRFRNLQLDAIIDSLPDLTADVIDKKELLPNKAKASGNEYEV